MNCFCCGSSVSVDGKHTPDNNPDGGTWVEINPGYGSAHDNMGNYPFYGIICDTCLENKIKFLKRFELVTKSTYVLVTTPAE